MFKSSNAFNVDVKAKQLWIMAALLFVASFNVGCAVLNEINPIGAANTAEQRAYAIYGTYVVFQEKAALLVRDRRIDKNVRRRIQQADKIVKPSADLMLTIANELQIARLALEKDQSTPAKVVELAERLSAAVIMVTPKVNALVKAVEAVE